MGPYIARRCAQMVVVFVAFLSLLFVLLNAAPGDITQKYLGSPNIPPEARELLARRLGLDQPLVTQYQSYMANFFTGDLGVSFSQYPRPVIDILIERLPRTVFLFCTATLLAYWMGFKSGKLLAWRRGRTGERAITVLGVGLHTVFQPWFYLAMIYVFSFIFGWFPTGHFIDDTLWRDAPFSPNAVFLRVFVTALVASALLVARRASRPALGVPGVGLVAAGVLGYWLTSSMRPYAADIVWHAILPVSTLALLIFGGAMLLTRGSMLEVLDADYILAARARGLPERVIRDRHAGRNALMPVVTSLVLALAFVVGGGIVAETIFSWPGMGEILVRSATDKDVPLAIGALGFMSVLAFFGHLAVDILYQYLDPRLRS